MNDFLVAFLLIYILLSVIIINQTKILRVLKGNCKIKEKSEEKQEPVETDTVDEYVVPAIICAINAMDTDEDFVVKSIKQVDNVWMLYSVFNTISGDE